jgi:hypothetical protein
MTGQVAWRSDTFSLSLQLGCQFGSSRVSRIARLMSARKVANIFRFNPCVSVYDCRL